MKYAAVLLVAFACSGALASEPGQPLDCSDWVMALPGLTCVDFGAYPVATEFAALGVNHVIDNESFIYRLGSVEIGRCGSMNEVPLIRWQVLRHQAGVLGEQVVATLDERPVDFSPGYCNTYNGARDPGGTPPGGPFEFDAAGGALLVRLLISDTDGQWKLRIFRLAGFPSMLDVLQSFTPAPSTVTFRVPLMPEGFAAADHFDTYWGPLSKPIDFTQAHPLACDYPAAPPHVGDYLTVADTVPTPAPGQGVYYVTSATYQGQTRYGRKTTAGHLSGRDPAVLPACVQP